LKQLSPVAQRAILDRIRTICLAFPGTSERASHGETAFFFREKRSFANTDTYHHGSEHYGLWVAAPLGAQDMLVRSDAEHFFVPPYVGHRGWVGITLDNDPDWDEVVRVIADAYAQVTRRPSGSRRSGASRGARSRRGS
jgi:predicted DNA-binding protein (MmcQ/YjbR family)